jgi:hypothetical protein
MFSSVEDEILSRYGGAVARRARGVDRLARFAMRAAQRRAERIHARIRRRLVNFDRDLDTTLAFSGPGE